MSLKIPAGSSSASTTQVSNPKVVEPKDKETMKCLFLELTAPIRNVQMSNNEIDRYKIIPLPKQVKQALTAEIEKWEKEPQGTEDSWD